MTPEQKQAREQMLAEADSEEGPVDKKPPTPPAAKRDIMKEYGFTGVGMICNGRHELQYKQDNDDEDMMFFQAQTAAAVAKFNCTECKKELDGMANLYNCKTCNERYCVSCGLIRIRLFKKYLKDPNFVFERDWPQWRLDEVNKKNIDKNKNLVNFEDLTIDQALYMI